MHSRAQRLERIHGLRCKVNVVVLEQSGDDQRREAGHGSAARDEGSRSPAALLADGVGQPQAACGRRGDTVSAGPRLEEVELAALLQKILECRRMSSNDVLDLNELPDRVEVPLPFQHFAPGIVDAPHIRRRLDAVCEKSTREILRRQRGEGAIRQLAVPAERAGDMPMQAQHSRRVVRGARYRCPVRERGRAGAADRVHPLVERAMTVYVARRSCRSHVISPARQESAPGASVAVWQPPALPAGRPRSVGLRYFRRAL